MKLIFSILLVLFASSIQKLHSQSTEQSKKLEVKLGLAYKHAFTLDGHIRVREFEVNGDILEWEQLGMNNFSVPGIYSSFGFNGKHFIEFNYDRLIFYSKKTIDRNIELLSMGDRALTFLHLFIKE